MTSSEELVREARAALDSTAPRVPRRHLAVVTCMDARIDPFRILNAQVGDILVLRNAGGVITEDVVRSLLVASHILKVASVQLIMHTDCALLGLDQGAVERDMGRLPFDLRAFSSLQQELELGVQRLRSEPLLDLPAGVTGHIYHVDGGRLSRVVH
jgi:carbonic anhydrase